MALRFAAALSTETDRKTAVAAVCRQALADLGGTPDLAIVFLSADYADDATSIAKELCATLGTSALLGCTGESIVGGEREIEQSRAISLWLASMPGVTIDLMHLAFERTSEGGTFVGWPDSLADEWPAGAALLMLGEPFSFPADALLERLNDDQQGTPVIGGMASGGHAPGENRLLLGPTAYDAGAVAALVSGPVKVRSVVSQGCRPIGRPMIVTKAQQNIIQELSGKTAMDQLREVWQTLSGDDQRLVQRGLHVGQVINEYQDTFGRGDFLVRNVVGADPEAGVIAIGDFARVGQTVQFHIRDAQTAHEDLGELLAAAKAAGQAPPAGALLFTCNGRGTRLFPEPHHDATAISQPWGKLPLAGFFAQGEIGPVGGKNFLHGFTASVALFEPVK